jgi:hypothetical protein
MLLSIEAVGASPWPTEWILPKPELPSLKGAFGGLAYFVPKHQPFKLVFHLQGVDPLDGKAGPNLSLLGASGIPAANLANQTCGLMMATALLAWAEQVNQAESSQTWRLHAFNIGQEVSPAVISNPALGQIQSKPEGGSMLQDWLFDFDGPLDALVKKAAAMLIISDPCAGILPQPSPILQVIAEQFHWLLEGIDKEIIDKKYLLLQNGSGRHPFASTLEREDPLRLREERVRKWRNRWQESGLAELEEAFLKKLLEEENAETIVDLFPTGSDSIIALANEDAVHQMSFHSPGLPDLHALISFFNSKQLSQEAISKLRISSLGIHYHQKPPEDAGHVLVRSGLLELPMTFRHQTLEELLGNWKPRCATILVAEIQENSGIGENVVGIEKREFEPWMVSLAKKHGYTIRFAGMPTTVASGLGLLAAIFTKEGNQ